MDQESPVCIVRAEPGEHDLMGDILGDAFATDPVMNWGMPNPGMYSGFFRMLAKSQFLRHQHCYRDSENRGAAMWLPPEAPFELKMSLTQLWLMLRLVTSTGTYVLKRLETLQKVMGENHPTRPHYYLQAIGARQAHQGKGIGSNLLKTVTLLCDERRMPAYLESSSENNLPLYQRHGFEIVDEYCLEPGGATLWFMWREPRANP